MPNPETKLTTEILKSLKKYGGFWVKIHGSAYQTSGLPDIVGCYRGQFIAIEVKMPGKAEDASLRQRHMLKRIRSAGGVPRIVTSTEEALEVVRSADRKLDKYEGWAE